MQPYFFPYIGYFQLLAAVDLFILYDNIKYTKKGWINRNRMLRDGKDVTFSLPLKSASDDLEVRERELAADFNRRKLLNQFSETYRRAPHFAQAFPLIERIVQHEETNLYRFLHHSITKTCEYLDIRTEVRSSSGIDIDHNLKSQAKVLAMCGASGARTYVNTMGGRALYSGPAFAEKGIDLRFIQPRSIEYAQFGAPFVPWLSILDVMMFNPPEAIRNFVGRFDLLAPQDVPVPSLSVADIS